MGHQRDYAQDQEMAKQFLRDFTHLNSKGEYEAKYFTIILELVERRELLLVIDLADLDEFNHDLCKQVERNPSRYHQIFCTAFDEILPPDKLTEKDTLDEVSELLEYFEEERNKTDRLLFINPINILKHRRLFSPNLLRRAEIAFKPITRHITPIKELLGGLFGKLITTNGIVQRVGAVKPKITVVCYTCDQCHYETFQAVKNNEFAPLLECSSSACKTTETRGRLTMQTRGSKFVKYQEVKLQEHSDLVPKGHRPEAITLVAHGEQTGKCEIGDYILVSGIFTIDEVSFHCGEFTVECFIEVHQIKQLTETGEELSADLLSDSEVIKLVQGNGNHLHRLRSSIAPEINGHEDLKLALLLLVVGGVDSSSDKMNIRGNLNICLVGDPSVARSQLLNFIDRLAPRSQFIRGRNSPSGSLTPVNSKDPLTGKVTLGAGALVLADQGICCIDGFGKMTAAERAAIREVMEQRTVSIGEDGRMKVHVSILAEVNPFDCCYDVHKTIEDNLPIVFPALLSLFDLLWLIQDRPDKNNDLTIADFVIKMYSKLSKRGEQQVIHGDIIDIRVLRRYINLCKTKNPIIPPELGEKLIQIHLTMRTKNKQPAGATSGEQAETLPIPATAHVAVVKMSTALARLRLSDVVEEADIDEAVRLLECSRASFEEQNFVKVKRDVDMLTF